jgi:mannosyl-3-phosphoglycerate phosphatase
MALRIVVTDLDATLLDRDTYSWEPARPALDRLRAAGIPCVFVSSKTRAEVEYWRREIGNTHPFVVENGGALVVPRDYFPGPVPGSVVRDGAVTVEWGTAYAVLVDALKNAAARSGCTVRGFSEMSVAEVASACALPEDQARLAMLREYDEPFTVPDPARAAALRAAIEEQGYHWTSGGRFEHITGDNDKGRAVRALLELYGRTDGDIVSVGLGDGLNDIPLLTSVTIPVVMPSPQSAGQSVDQSADQSADPSENPSADPSAEMTRLVPQAGVAAGPGPEGWNRAVLSLLAGPLRP